MSWFLLLWSSWGHGRGPQCRAVELHIKSNVFFATDAFLFSSNFNLWKNTIGNEIREIIIWRVCGMITGSLITITYCLPPSSPARSPRTLSLSLSRPHSLPPDIVSVSPSFLPSLSPLPPSGHYLPIVCGDQSKPCFMPRQRGFRKGLRFVKWTFIGTRVGQES